MPVIVVHVFSTLSLHYPYSRPPVTVCVSTSIEIAISVSIYMRLIVHFSKVPPGRAQRKLFSSRSQLDIKLILLRYRVLFKTTGVSYLTVFQEGLILVNHGI